MTKALMKMLYKMYFAQDEESYGKNKSSNDNKATLFSTLFLFGMFFLQRKEYLKMVEMVDIPEKFCRLQMCKWMRSGFFASGIHPPCTEGL